MSNFLLFPVIVSSEVGYTVRGRGPPSLPLSRGREGARRTVRPRRSSLFWSPLAPTSFSRSRGGPLRPDLTQVSCLCWYIFSLFFSLKFVIVNVVFVPLFQCTADCAAGSPMPLRRTAMPLNGCVSWAVFDRRLHHHHRHSHFFFSLLCSTYTVPAPFCLKIWQNI